MLYAASKTSLLLKCRPFTLEHHEKAFQAINYLSQYYQSLMPKMMIELQNSNAEGIRSSRSVNDLLKWLKITKENININSKIYLIKLIIDCLELYCYENPKETLLFLAQSDISREIDVNYLINKALDLSLKQVENESKACNLESFGKFKEKVQELSNWIGLITPNNYIWESISEAKLFLSHMLESLEHSLCEPKAIPDTHQSKENLQQNSEEDLPLKKSRISKESCVLKYIRDDLSVFIRQGYLDNSQQVSIKYFLLSSSEQYELFAKEKYSARLLSGKHPCFLKYYGWFCHKWSNDKQEFEARAIVTENFKTTLIEDIMFHSKNKIKYNQLWFLKTVKSLLDAFYYLEKLSIPHFDIRPHNILVVDNDELKISGFNFSGMKLERTSKIATEEGHEIWRDSYDAPELRGSQGFCRDEIFSVIKAGIFSLGLVFLQMYHCFTKSKNQTRSSEIEPQDYKSQIEQMSFPKHAPNFEFSKKIELSLLKTDKMKYWVKATLGNGQKVIFKKGKYNNDDVLIRTFESQEPSNLLPFLEEAEILQKLDGKNSLFIRYYGLEWLYIKDKSLYSLSIITELCENSLIADITIRAQKEEKEHYNENQLKYCFSKFLEGFIVLKDNRCDHDNIKPHIILFDKNNCIKISGFITPKHKIESCCIFPNYRLQPLQNSSGYLSPEKRKSKEERILYDIESSDVFSLGLVFLQMSNLEPVDNWNNEEDFLFLQTANPFWLSQLLQKMLHREPSRRLRFREAYDEMQKYIRGDQEAPKAPISFIN